MSAGRKPAEDRDKIVEEFRKKKHILVENGKIVPIENPIWAEISKIFENKIKPNSLHSKATNRDPIYGLRSILINDANLNNDEISFLSGSENCNDSLNFSTNDSHYFKNKNEIVFVLTIPKKEFRAMTHIVEKKVRKFGRRACIQTKLEFKKEKNYTSYFNTKIWESLQIRCSFRYKNYYLALDKKSGNLTGTKFFRKINIFLCINNIVFIYIFYIYFILYLILYFLI